MEGILVLLALVAVLGIVVVTHLRPLSSAEVNTLASKRRGRSVRSYFSFDNHEYNPNKEFKKRMEANGSFYHVKEGIFEFSSSAAALLKYKKHEWIIIAFEKEKTVNLIWVNKGFDRSSVSLYLPNEALIKTAKQYATSVLIFHNHPNINPNYYSYIKPSEKDIASAKQFAMLLNNNDINLVEFVCERGKHYEYFLSASSSFLPVQEFIQAINYINGKSKFRNLFLHLERIFTRNQIPNIEIPERMDLSSESSQEEIKFPIGQLKSPENSLCRFKVNNGAFYLDLIALDLKARRKSDIIREMVGLFTSAGIVKDGQTFYEKLLWRESLGSTGIGQGIAIPYIYADLTVEEEIVTALAIVKEGVDFDSLDGEPVRLIFMSAHKQHEETGQSSSHLKHLARISRFLRSEEHRQTLLAVNTKEEAFFYLKTNFIPLS